MICPNCGTEYDEATCPVCGDEPEPGRRRGFGAGGLFPGWLAGLLVLAIILALGAAATAVVLVLGAQGTS